MAKKARVRVKRTFSETHRIVHATGAEGGHTPIEMRIKFYQDIPVYKETGLRPEIDHVERRYEVEVVMSPPAAKQLAVWLFDHVRRYEEQFGPIAPKLRKPLPPGPRR